MRGDFTMSVKRSYKTDGSEYTVTYSDMRGVDFSSDTENSKRYRFRELENMYKDYTGGGAGIVESIPGYRKLYSFYRRIHAIYTHKDRSGEEYAVIHAKDKLFRFKMKERDSLSALKPIAELKNRKSTGFVSGTDLFILDSSKITRVTGDGVASAVDDSTDASPYVPTTYYCGEEYEQRNLLTDKFREIYKIGAASELSYGTEGLKFTIISEKDFTASVSGIEGGVVGVVSIPAYVDISGVRYKVTEISDRAFYQNKSISELYLPATVERIGISAFQACFNLTKAVIENGVRIIDNGAFFDCQRLSEVYIGSGVSKIEVAAFSNCPLLLNINYALDSASFSKIEMNYAHIANHTLIYGSPYKKISVEVPIFSPATELYSVKLGGIDSEYSEKIRNGTVTSIVITKDDRSELNGKEVEISGKMDPAKFTKNSVGSDFLAIRDGEISGKDAIFGCTVAESFDGRIFLSGNPKLPNTVFYSSRDLTGRNNPLYFGVLNYFNDGIGGFGVESMLAAGDSLAVFKSGDDGGGSIYYHTPRETGIDIMPKVYPVTYVHSGISAIGPSISFFDDPIFLSTLGVTALDKKAINLERSIATRSHNVNPRLLSENLNEAEMTKWLGYLVLLTGERIYLADSRETFSHSTGNVEYEWYFLSGIGSFSGGDTVYRFSNYAPEGFYVHERVGEVCSGEVYGTMENGVTVLYVEIEGKRYTVYSDEERIGGTFSPACCIHSPDGELLLFGTESGDICIFNNDMRGEPPLYMKEIQSFDYEDYKENHKGELNPYYYSFDMHKPRYVLRTANDNGGFSNLTKNTVKKSFALKYKSLGKGDVYCTAGTDKGEFREVGIINDTYLDFGDFDFERLGFENTRERTVALPENEKNWIEKSIALYSDGFAAPFGFCSLTYKFKIKGRIKNQKG